MFGCESGYEMRCSNEMRLGICFILFLTVRNLAFFFFVGIHSSKKTCETDERSFLLKALFRILLHFNAQMDPLRNSFNSNKRLKEEFVSNLTGSSILEIVSFSTIVPALIVLRHYVFAKGLYGPLHAKKITSRKEKDGTIDGRSWRIYISTLVMDFLFIVLPTLLFLTVLAEWTNICAICLILLLLFCIGDKR